MIKHHGEFTLHAFLYVARLIAERRYDEVRQMGLCTEQAEAIRSMTTQDLHEISLTIRGNFLDIRLDPEAFDAAYAALQQRKTDDGLDRALIMAGARFEMMRRLCGMTNGEYAQHRRYLGLGADGRGRPEMPSEDVQAAIWQAWLDCAEIEPLKRRYLAVHQRTNVAVGTIWRLIAEWESSGLTPILPARDKSEEL